MGSFCLTRSPPLSPTGPLGSNRPPTHPGIRFSGRPFASAAAFQTRRRSLAKYAQVGGHVYHGQPDEVAIQTFVFTRRGLDRIVRFAFELAVKRNGKKKVTSITKSNAQGYSMVSGTASENCHRIDRKSVV